MDGGRGSKGKRRRLEEEYKDEVNVEEEMGKKQADEVRKQEMEKQMMEVDDKEAGLEPRAA